MKTEKDKEIDDLFKRGLEPADTHSSDMDGDWEAMEQMLDERKRRPMIIYWLPILGSVAAVLLLVIGWWLLRPVVTPKNPKEQKVAVQQPKEQKGNEEKEQQRTARDNKIDTVTPPDELPAKATNTAIAKNTSTVKSARRYDRTNATNTQNL